MKKLLGVLLALALTGGAVGAPWEPTDVFADQKAELAKVIEGRFDVSAQQAEVLAQSAYAYVPSHLMELETFALLNSDVKNFSGTVELSLFNHIAAAAVDLCGYPAMMNGVIANGNEIRAINVTLVRVNLFDLEADNFDGTVDPRKKQRWDDILDWQRQTAATIIANEGCGEKAIQFLTEFSRLHS